MKKKRTFCNSSGERYRSVFRGSAKAKQTQIVARFWFTVSFLLPLSTASTWRQMNLDASRAYFPSKIHRARNGGDNAFGNVWTPSLGPKPSDLFFNKQQPSARNCFVKLKYREIDWCFTSCRDAFVDDRLGETSAFELRVVKFVKDIINGCFIVVVEHTNCDVFFGF